MNERSRGFAPAENQNEITREFSPQEQEALRNIDGIRRQVGPELAQRALELFTTKLNEAEIARRKQAAQELMAVTKARPKVRGPVRINFAPPAEAMRSTEGADLSEHSLRARYRR